MSIEVPKPAISKQNYEVVVKAVLWFIVLEQIRKQATDEADLQLTESIRSHGVLQPVGARHDGKLVWGHRRLRCAIAAGLTEIPAVVLDKDMAEGEYLTLQMQENVQRIDVSPIDMYEGCVRLLQVNGWQQKDLARQLKLSAGQVSKIMSVGRLTEEFRQALKAGVVTASSAYKASTYTPERQALLLQEIVTGNAAPPAPGPLAPPPAGDAAEKGDKLDRVRLVVPGCTLTLVGKDLTLQATIQKLSAALEHARKADRENLDISTLARVLADRSRAKS